MMKFIKFCRYLERLEAISSRLEMTDLLAELLDKLSIDEVDKGVYLMLGNLAPKFRKKEFNLAEKQVMKAIAKITGKDEKGILKAYKRTGDLGEVACRFVVWADNSKLTIVQIYERLKNIAEEGGEGSQDRKISDLAKLFGEIGAIEAKYIVRIILSKLRLGFSDKTILDAISVIERGDKTMRKDLDAAYQYYPDVGRLIKIVKRDGIKKLFSKIKIELGVPVLPALCQRLNSAFEIIEKMDEVGVEKKFDGTRVQIHFKKGRNGLLKTFTRNLDENSHMFVELFDIGEYLKAESVILDAEAVGVDEKTEKLLPFQLTVTRKRKHGIGEAANRVPLKFFVFDILYKNGKSLIDKSYGVRREILKNLIRENRVLAVDGVTRTKKTIVVHKLHEEFLQEGLEGAVVKKWGGQYLPGRQGWNWVKIKESEGKSGKLSDTLDLIVMGFYKGRGRRAKLGLGAFLAGIIDGDRILTIAKIGTGLADEQLISMQKKFDRLLVNEKPKEFGDVDKSLVPDGWVVPSMVVEVAADEITTSPVHSSGMALRFPRLIRIRADKDWSQATNTEEIKEMRG